MLKHGAIEFACIAARARYHLPQHRERLDGGLHPPARRIRRRAGRKCPAAAGSARGVETSTVRRVYDQFLAQQTRSSGTNLARLDAFASQAARIDNLFGDPANGLSSSLQSFTDAINEVSTHAGIDPGAPGADRRRACAGRTTQELRHAPARHVGRGQWPAQRRSAGNHHARAGNRQAQRRNRRRHPAERPAAQRSARPARCAHQRAVGQGGRYRRRRRRFHAQRIHRQWPAAGARHHGLADHHDRWIRSIRNARCCPCAPARAPWTCRASSPAERSAACSTGAARCSIRRATSSAASASPSPRRSTRSIARAWTSPARWAATSSTSARPPRRLPRPTPARRWSRSTRTNLGALTANDYVLARTATGYTLRRQDTGAAVSFTGTGTVRGSDSRRRLVHRRGRGHRDRRSVHDSSRRAMRSRASSVAITDPARVAAAAPIRASAATTQHGHRHRDLGRSARPDQRGAADHGQHRCSLRRPPTR